MKTEAEAEENNKQQLIVNHYSPQPTHLSRATQPANHTHCHRTAMPVMLSGHAVMLGGTVRKRGWFMSYWQDKVVLITGGAAGLGRRLSTHFAQAGAHSGAG